LKLEITGTKLGIAVILIYFVLQCTVVDAPEHNYFDNVSIEEVERIA
jgi:hypothetical protein